VGIYPGEKLMDLFIDDPFSTCLNKYGDNFNFGFEHGYFHISYLVPEFWLLVEDSDFNGNLDETDSIVLITVWNDSNYSETTEGGNGIGSSCESIENEFGECHDCETICPYDDIGIEFGMNRDNKCGLISVFGSYFFSF